MRLSGHGSSLAAVSKGSCAHTIFRGEFPFAQIDFHDPALPVAVQLEAFTPLIPLNPADSGIPCAILTYLVTNTSQERVAITLVGSLVNPVGGLRLVQAVRDRHDGLRPNPWDEVEYGHHYARSMSSWMLMLAASGFHCDLSEPSIDFAPVMSLSTEVDTFSTFWSNGAAWGTFTRRKDETSGTWQPDLQVLGGDASALRVTVDGA